MCDYLSNVQANSIKAGGYIILKGLPCKVVEVHKSKTGKHGSAKMRFVGIDIFTRKKVEDWYPGSDMVESPEVKKYDIRVTDMDETTVTGTVVKGKGHVQKTFPLPQGRQESLMELVDEIRERYDSGQPTLVTIASAVGKEAVVGVKGSKNSDDSD